MTFSRQILVGLGLGIAVGLFLGERVAPLGIVADGFVKLLQMTVLPYVTVSIVASLGRLDLEQAKRLGLRAGAVLASLWILGLGVVFLFPLVFPPAERASFFSSSLIEKAPPFDFVGLYIPANPFHSLANNIVPAVVLFAVITGTALIGIERKGLLLDVLGILSATISRATGLVVRLTPYGIFALAATAAGTLRLEQLERIEVYLVAYVAISLVMALWILPGLVAALTPIPYREVLPPSRDALITAFVAGDLFIVLPILIASCKELLERYAVTDAHGSMLPDVIVPASFNFPHTGKLLSLSFIVFAGWFADAAVRVRDYPQLAITGLLTAFGSLNSAVPFLLDLFRIPADTFQLFVATGVINAHFGTLTAAVHTIAVALIGSAAIAGTLRFDSRRLIRYAVATLVVLVATIGGLRLTFRTLLQPEFKGRDLVYGMTNLLERQPSTIVESSSPDHDKGANVIDRIRARGTLRVGFVAERMPFVFRNREQELVGFDVELAHLLARDLDVGLQFVEYRSGDLVRAVSEGAADLGIGGNPVTPRLASESLFSEPYLDETAAFLVKDYLRGRFETWTSIRDIRNLTIGIPAVPYYERAIRTRLDGVPLKAFGADDDPLAEQSGFDAVLLPAERGSVLTLLNPQWTVVVPQPGIIKVPIAFPLVRGDQSWASLVNTWIELKRSDGTLDALYDHWILGKAAERRAPRWSVVRDVLHWTD
jgi:Na+/H+-dicarboxylate symporter/ABC-type amino acid transport substrate-binding protein